LPSPQFLIGSVVISLSRCRLPDDEGPGLPPPNIFSYSRHCLWGSGLYRRR